METLALALNPDEAARGPAVFDEMMRRYQRQVFGTAWRLLGNTADAQGAAQEVFLRLHKHLGRIQGDCGPWIYRVTVNVCRDISRRRREQPLEETAAPEVLESDTHRRERRELLDRALRRLSERERAALVLRDLEGLSTREAAGVLGTSEATVRSQTAAARLKLKRFLEGLMGRRV